MRGHWISTTRKFNKHYQGGGGTAPTPPPIDDLTLTWQRFMTTDAFCPVGFYHEDDPTQISQHAPNNFYNMFVTHGRYASQYEIYDHILNVNLNFDLSKSNKLIGPYNRHSHYYIPSPSYGSLPNDYGDRDWLTHQYDESVLQNVSTFDPDYNFVTYHGSTYSDFGIRYTKFIVPKYLGSPYYNTYRNSSNSIGGQISFPVESKIDLSAIASKAFAEQYGGIDQTVVIKTGTSSSNIHTINLGTNATMCPYDLEQNGQSYVEFITSWGAGTNIKVRIYCFYYNGCFYLDQKPHVFNINTGEEIETDRVSIRRLAYPYPLLGFCGMSPFYQPPGLYYPSYPSYGSVPLPSPAVNGILDVDGYYDQDGRARKYYTYYEKDWDNGTQTSYSIKKYPLFPELVQEEVSESTFWVTERAWHATHGGTPYLTPSI